jgi:extracellular elastinolytic metalloproteinase
MSTPPDGQAGKIAMFLFDMTKPQRDGSLANDIPMHEFTHGLSNRLTGGANKAGCLAGGESGGMGEGWSDAVAMFVSRTANNTRTEDIIIGQYVIGQESGIRRHPYSTSLETNPYLFSTLNKMREVHDIGEVWAAMMLEMYQNLTIGTGT